MRRLTPLLALATLPLLALVAPPPAPLAAATSPAVQEEASGEAHRRAMELYRAGKLAEALPLFRKALELTEARYGDDSPVLADDLNNLAEIHRQLGQSGAAEPLLRRALRLDEAVGEDNPGLAITLNNLALVYREQGRLKEAEALYKRSLVLTERALGMGHPDVAKGLNNLAVLYRMRGEPAKARPLQERAVAIAEKGLGPDHPTTKLLRRNLELVAGEPAAVAAADADVAKPAGARTAAAGAKPAAKATAAGSPRKAAAAAAGPAPAVPPREAPAAREPAPRRLAAVPPPPPAPPPAAPAGAPRSGRFAIHVASVGDPGGVGPEWQRVVRRYPALAGHALRPAQEVDVPGKGRFYRVTAGAFATRAEATAACAALRADGRYCAVLAP